MKRIRMFVSIAVLLILSIVLLTGCATMESIAGKKNIKIMVDMNSVAAPEISKDYKIDTGFPRIDAAELAQLIYGETERTRYDNADRVTFLAADKSYLDLILTEHRTSSEPITDEVLENECMTILYVRGNFDLYFYTYLRNAGFEPSHGKVSELLAESGEDDPIMESSILTAKVILDSVGYTDYEIDFAGKYTQEVMEELARYHYFSEIPSNEPYMIRFRLKQEEIPEEAYWSDRWADFVFDKDGICIVYIQGVTAIEVTESGETVSVKDAYEQALAAFSKDDIILFDVKYGITAADRTECRSA